MLPLTRRISILADVEAGYLFADERAAGSTFTKRLALKIGGAPGSRASPYLAGGYVDVGVQRGLGVLPVSGDGGPFLAAGAEWKLGRRAGLFAEAYLGVVVSDEGGGFLLPVRLGLKIGF